MARTVSKLSTAQVAALKATGSISVVNNGVAIDIALEDLATYFGSVDTDPLYAPTITEATTARTLSLTDAGAYIRLTNASSCVITVPPLAWAVDTEIAFRISNTGIPSITEGAGVTVNNKTALATMAQHQTFALKRVALNTWDVI